MQHGLRKLAALVVLLLVAFFALPAAATCTAPVPNFSIGSIAVPAATYIVYLHPDTTVTRWVVGAHDVANNTNNFYAADFGSTSSMHWTGPGWTSDGTHVITSMSFPAHQMADGIHLEVSINGESPSAIQTANINNGLFGGQATFNGGLTAIVGGGTLLSNGHPFVDFFGINNGVSVSYRRIVEWDCTHLSADSGAGEWFSAMPEVKPTPRLWWQ